MARLTAKRLPSRAVTTLVGVVRGRDLVHGIKHRMERRDGAIHAIQSLPRRTPCSRLPADRALGTEPTRVITRQRAEEARGDERCARRRGPRGE
jgi:hypothetical protein